MPDTNSRSRPALVKPERPEGSPLFWHQSGRWAKKIRGKLVYFGRGSHDDAIALYDRQKTDLHAGRRPREDSDANGLTVYTLCARFLKAKMEQRDQGELGSLMFEEYGKVCKRLLKAFGKTRVVADLRPADFAMLRKQMGRTWGPVRLKAEIIRTRTPFLWAVKNGEIDRAPVFGEGFKTPTEDVIRKVRSKQPLKLFEAGEIRQMLAAAGQPLKAMLLLGINCGFGNGDISAVTVRSVDQATGWLTFPRPKTGIERRVPLWPETVSAIHDWLAIRPEPINPKHADLLFITSKRGSWRDETGRSLSHEMRKLLDKVNLKSRRGFYCLRHSFQTFGDECTDFIAVRKIMGHASRQDIADTYRERVSDERLKKVTEHVRQWLFADTIKSES